MPLSPRHREERAGARRGVDSLTWRSGLVAVALTLTACGAPEARLGLRTPGDRALLALDDKLGTFERATAFDVAPSGAIYVADAAIDALVVIDRLREVRVEGGPGTEDGQFDLPADVDAGNGLVIYVADAGNHRVQRFSREFRHLGSVGIDAASFGQRSGTAQANSQGRGGGTGFSGRPIAVVTSAADELFVIDENADVVLKWDASLQPDRIIGDFGSGAAQLVEPVDLATDGHRHLYVADAARRSIFVFDLLGSFVREIRLDASDRPVGVSTAATGDIVVITPERLLVLGPGGGRLVLEPDVADRLVDARIHDGWLYVLSETGLYRAPHPVSHSLPSP